MTEDADLAAALSSWLHDHPEDGPLRDRPLPTEATQGLLGSSGFGTGGMRGRVGIGPGRINASTLAVACRAHAAWLRRRFGEEASVVMAFDGRCFDDQEGRWGPQGPPASVRGLRSVDLARACGEVYRVHGVHVWWPDGMQGVATPQASFFARRCGAHGACVISASHNPPDDNGMKLYDEGGRQLLPLQVEEVLACAPEPTATAGERRTVPSAWWSAYRRQAVPEVPSLSGARVFLAPLHGCAVLSVAGVLETLGADVVLDPVTAGIRGDGAGLHGRTANPEDPALYGPICGRADGCDVVLLADPDADRIGLAERSARGWRVFDGHELAMLCLDAAMGLAAGRPLRVAATAVTTRALQAMVQGHAGVQLVDDLPVGFKFIARALDDHPAAFLLGLEESHGILWGPNLGDKDASAGAALLVWWRARMGERGIDLSARLAELKHQAGDPVFRKPTWRLLDDHVQASWEGRGAPLPSSLLGQTAQWVDGREGIVHDAQRRARTAWTVHLDGAQLVLRPSGTEPKLKAYVEAWGEAADARADALCEALTTWAEGEGLVRRRDPRRDGAATTG